MRSSLTQQDLEGLAQIYPVFTRDARFPLMVCSVRDKDAGPRSAGGGLPGDPGRDKLTASSWQADTQSAFLVVCKNRLLRHTQLIKGSLARNQALDSGSGGVARYI